MSLSPFKIKVIDVITKYVDECGGIVALEDLLEDYGISYHREIPFAQFGFSSIEDFLESIDGISICEDEEGILYVESVEHHDDRQTNEVDDLTQLSVQMENSLLLSRKNNARVVTIQSSNCTKDTSRMNSLLSNCGKGVSGDKSRSLSNLDNYSTHEYSQNNLARPRSNNYLCQSVRPLTHKSYSNTKTIPRNENCDAPEDCLKSKEKFTDNVYSSSMSTKAAVPDFSKRHENIYPLDVHRTNNTAYNSTYTPDENALNLTRPVNDASKSHEKLKDMAIFPPTTVQSVLPLQHIFEAQGDCIPKIHQSALPLEISTKKVSSSNLPAFPAFRRKLLSTNSFTKPEPQDKVLVNGSGDWITKEAHKRSLTNNWQDDLPKLTEVEITERIIRIVNSHKQFGGIDGSTLELKYKEKYSTTLPKGWLNLLQELGVLYVEEFTSCAIVYPSRFFPVPPTITSLPALRYPDINHFWNVYVTLYESTTYIWFRVKDEDFDEKYEILRREMNRHYSRAIDSIEYLAQISTAQLCVVNYGKQWSRCEVLESDAKAGWVKCFLLDEGNIEIFPSDKVYPLHEKFTNTPALILRGQLNSLEKWENCNFVNCKIRQVLLDKPDVTIKIHKFLSHYKVSMQLYVDSQSGRVDLNSKISNLVGSEFSLPILYAGQTYDIDILKAMDNHSFQINIESPSLRLLKETLHRVTKAMKIPEEAKIKSTLQIVSNKIYLAHCEDEWKRIIATRFLAEDHFVASFIDFGEEKIVYLHEIFDTSIAQDAVCFIEPQAIQIKVLDCDDAALRYVEYAKIRQNMKISYAMKVLQPENTSLVQLLVRIPEFEEFVPISNFSASLKYVIPGAPQN